ncbi:glutaminase family protein [Paenibacillus harenae]|uniref:glutaminase family protein n=1 Tax=Paenibacillus harenae TaxID=306543 RepID=UPI00278F0855|nr:glutaminase family protein [Paenibacillus harenae]MDQ0060243.1 hypothetical protein [Paenibacillus harenae]
MTQTLRPPSVPLITVDPYFSVWSAADRLYDDHTTHWTNKRNSMAGIIRIDGKPRRFMGKDGLTDLAGAKELPAMEQKSVKVEPLTSTYVFEADGIELEAAFMTPLLQGDLELLSRPASYMTFRVRSTDGNPHHVQIYIDLSSELCVHSTEQSIRWSRAETGGRIAAMRIGTEEQPILKRIGDDTRIDWGYVCLAVPQSDGLQTAIHSAKMRMRFADSGQLPEKDDDAYPREAADDPVAMAAVFDFGETGEQPLSRYAIAAYDDIHSIEYFGKPLEAYWRTTGMTFEEMLNLAAEQYDEIAARCGDFNRKLIRESTLAGGEKYADLLSLAYRQAIAAHKLVAGERGELLFFSKENFSNGCIATVDVSYPSIPLFLHGNPELVKGMMRPIFRYAASEAWTFDFAPHDVGCYPSANGQVYGENKLEYQMPIEECGNMLIMAAAVSLYEGNAAFAREHWELLTRWAAYLKEHGMDPANQLCTDDFAGHLAHNANLSIKAIIGIGGYSILCSMLGEPEGETYLATAKEMAAKWVEMAIAGDHYKLTFDSSPDTWSLKYNLVWDRLFGLHLFPTSVADDEIKHYLAKQNKYGTPLDSRSTYTKADWLVWCASMAASKEQFEQLIEPLWHFLNETPSRVPFTDWYDTVSGKQIGFQNRSVVGGLFLPLLKDS